MLRAYDKRTGAEVGAVYLPAPQSGSPMTYMLNGKQYLVPGHQRRQLQRGAGGALRCRIRSGGSGGSRWVRSEKHSLGHRSVRPVCGVRPMRGAGRPWGAGRRRRTSRRAIASTARSARSATCRTATASPASICGEGCSAARCPTTTSAGVITQGRVERRHAALRAQAGRAHRRDRVHPRRLRPDGVGEGGRRGARAGAVRRQGRVCRLPPCGTAAGSLYGTGLPRSCAGLSRTMAALQLFARRFEARRCCPSNRPRARRDEERRNGPSGGA